VVSSIFGLMIAGLGLFFLGLRLVGANLQELTSRRFRSLIARFTDRLWLSIPVGILAGGLLQSTSAVAVILASMAASRLISVHQALPIIAWANAGTTLLVFIAALDIRLAVLYLVGLAGIGFAFSKEMPWKALYGVVLGIGLLLYGIDAMKTSAADLHKFSWFQAVMLQSHGSYMLALAAATFLSFITQSTTAVVLIAVTLVDGGLLAPAETIMVIYGGNLGSTFSRMILASGLRGGARQIGRFQDMFKIFGVLLFIILFYAEVIGSIPLVYALARNLSNQVSTQMALVNLFFNAGMALVLTPWRGPLERFLAWMWPTTAEEDLAKLQYLYPEALTDPETALDLMEKEQGRLLGQLPAYLSFLRPGPTGPAETDYRALHQGFQALAREMDSYLTTLVEERHSPETTERLMNVKDRQGLIVYIEDTVSGLARALARAPLSGHLATLVTNILEATDLLLNLTAAACGNLDESHTEVLTAISGDRGAVMETIRKRYLSGQTPMTPAETALVFTLTAQFERLVWLIDRLVALLSKSNPSA
jgi:phosphate:Na+ symporter